MFSEGAIGAALLKLKQKILSGTSTPPTKARQKSVNVDKTGSARMEQEAPPPPTFKLSHADELISVSRPKEKTVQYRKKNPAHLVKNFLDYFERIELGTEIKSNFFTLSGGTQTQLRSWEEKLRESIKHLEWTHENIVDVVIGFDFGTSSAKIIVRLPYEGEGGTAFAFPVPKEFRADNHPHCWKTILYIDEDKKNFSLSPSENSKTFANFKAAAMQDNPSKIIFRSGNTQLIAESMCYIYFGLLLRKVKGWLISEIFPSLGIDITKRSIQWELNLGLPAAKRDNKKIGKRFEVIAKNAWFLSKTTEPIIVDKLNSLLSQKNKDTNVAISVRPEVVAQTVGIMETTLPEFGLYGLADIGASTIDICTFNYGQKDGYDSFSLFFAKVGLFGVSALNWIDIIRQKFNVVFTQDELKMAVKYCLNETLATTKSRRAPNAKEWSSQLTIFLCGGGRESIPHRSALREYIEDVNNYRSGKYRFEETMMPERLEHESSDSNYHRLSVAWGLSIPNLDFANYKEPADIDDIEGLKERDYSNLYIGKEQV